jgi:hypothetical protein
VGTRSLYLVGGPGAGKSTLMARLLAHWQVGPNVRVTEKELFGHRLADGGDREGLYLGVLREQFPGTDGLSLSVNRVAVPWAADPQQTGRYDLILAEGGRLANRPFLSALSSTTKLLLVHLAVDFDVARARSDARPDQNTWKPWPTAHPGKKLSQRANRGQADTWLKSGAGRAAKLAAEYPSVTINTSHMKPEEIEETLCLLY